MVDEYAPALVPHPVILVIEQEHQTARFGLLTIIAGLEILSYAPGPLAAN
jgi:hypothetical protein